MANPINFGNKINVNVAGQKQLHVLVSNTSATLINSSVPVALKNNPTFSGSLGVNQNRVEDLRDVLVVDKTENSTLSYSPDSNKYEIKQLKLDGGTF